MTTEPAKTEGDESRLLEVSGLTTVFPTRSGTVTSVDGVGFAVDRGEVLAIVGESGSGKSVTSLSIMRLIRSPGTIAGGSVKLQGADLLRLSPKQMRDVRSRRISMIFQDPLSALNPVFTIGNQLGEKIRTAGKIGKRELREQSLDLLRQVGIRDPELTLRRFPHQLSGGMRQRVMIAMALSNKPQLLIADEPTTALDVTIQAQILQLIRKLCRETGTGVIFITHDLGVVAEMADRVAVMYAGRIVEQATATELFDNAKHPYTRGLLGSMPTIDQQREELYSIPGTVPPLTDLPTGCAFQPRCPYATELCSRQRPILETVGSDGHEVSCFHPREAGT
ncbi:ABC transporter ATP-binding protein [Paenibacillus hodogayensis]|uniref:ABC transporter ATP-binding protein n=1 Tax=Paenibacillus hodogayensis TaxID=279208 RepID=A0ABV5W6M8_9BACL